jgi:hypothetical protein
MKRDLLLRQIDYWLITAKFYVSKGDGFDHLVFDALNRAQYIMDQIEMMESPNETV